MDCRREERGRSHLLLKEEKEERQQKPVWRARCKDENGGSPQRTPNGRTRDCSSLHEHLFYPPIQVYLELCSQRKFPTKEGKAQWICIKPCVSASRPLGICHSMARE